MPVFLSLSYLSLGLGMFSDLQLPKSLDNSGTGTADGHSVSFFLCHLDPRKIFLLRFLLEGYDGLTTLTTLDASRGLVRCLVSNGQHAVLYRLLESLNAEGRISSFISLDCFSEMFYNSELEPG